MTQLSRRAFLKSLAAIVSGSFVPIDLITKLSVSIDDIVESPITKDNPLGFIILNGTKFPFWNCSVSRDLGAADVIYSGVYPYHKLGTFYSEPEIGYSIDIKLPELDYLGYVKREANFNPVNFRIVTYNPHSEVNGEGYITQIYRKSKPIFWENINFPDCGFEIRTESYLRQ